MTRQHNEGRSRSWSTSNEGSGSRRHGESSSISAGGSRTMGSQEDLDTQLDHHWVFLKATGSNEHESIAITLYYPARKSFSKSTYVTYHKCYFDAKSRTLVIEVNPN